MTDRVPLGAEEIDGFVAGSGVWAHRDGALVAVIRLSDFKVALSFLVAVGLEAEALDHHPEIHNIYNKVTLTLRTHDAGNRVTGLDVALARAVEAIAARFMGG